LLQKQRIVRNIFITGVSLFFYYKTAKLFVLFLAASMFWNVAIGKKIASANSPNVSKKWMISGLTLNILVLIYFKYGFFFTESYNALFQTDFKLLNIFAVWGNGFFGSGSFETKLFAAGGVSFITFQSISYILDVYRKEVEPVKNVTDYTFYATFFPHVYMGPIARAKEFIPQIYKPYYLDKIDFSASIFLILRGLTKKLVLADFIAGHFVDVVLKDPSAYPGFLGIIAMWSYSLYIYGDFSGYTDMATGIARLMGFRLGKNFDSPYKSVSVADFWRRWHKSLGSFFRDYLYIPLGGNKTGGFGSFVMIAIIMLFLIFITGWFDLLYIYAGITALYLLLVRIFPSFKTYVYRDLNLLITMVVGGLWHGPSQNFVIWGTMNGLALVIFNYWRKVSPYEQSEKWLSHAWKIFLTFNFITFTRIWFRLQDNDAPYEFLDHVFNHFDFSGEQFSRYFTYFLPEMLVLIFGMTIHWLPNSLKNKVELQFSKQHIVTQVILTVLIVFIIYQAVTGVSRGFLYGNF
jgi:D-alanyl-lipoteichoic acid acyltransferase DltB (MBOAT superfamily)